MDGFEQPPVTRMRAVREGLDASRARCRIQRHHAETLVRALPEYTQGSIELRFELDGALPPEVSDSRERGIIVASIEVE